MTMSGLSVFLGDCENRLALVKIYAAPAELPDTVLIGRLSSYGKVLIFRRDKIAQHIENGVRTARMNIQRTIQNTISVAGEIVRFGTPTSPNLPYIVARKTI